MEAIITQTPAENQALKGKRITSRNQPNLAIERDAVYTRRESSRAVRVSESTLVRAYQSGHLKAHTVGNRILHTGAQLLSWLQRGGKTA
jgi:hypothetical protein